LKPRLYKGTPPPQTEEDNVILIALSSLQPAEARECLSRRGFNRPLISLSKISGN
jgi:hypothetical protein